MLDAAARRVGGPGHRGDPALRLRPVGQEGHAAHLDRRAAGGRPAGRRGRQPGADDDPALAAGARLLQRSRWTTCTRCASWPPTSGATTWPTPWWSRRTWATPRRRPRSRRLLGTPVAAGAKQRFRRRPGQDQLGDRRRGGPGHDRAGRRDRQGQHGDRAARTGCASAGPARSGWPAPTACSPAARWSGSRAQAEVAGDRLHQHGADARRTKRVPQAERAVGGPGAGRGDAAHPQRRVGQRPLRAALAAGCCRRPPSPSACPLALPCSASFCSALPSWAAGGLRRSFLPSLSLWPSPPRQAELSVAGVSGWAAVCPFLPEFVQVSGVGLGVRLPHKLAVAEPRLPLLGELPGKTQRQALGERLAAQGFTRARTLKAQLSVLGQASPVPQRQQGGWHSCGASMSTGKCACAAPRLASAMRYRTRTLPVTAGRQRNPPPPGPGRFAG